MEKYRKYLYLFGFLLFSTIIYRIYRSESNRLSVENSKKETINKPDLPRLNTDSMGKISIGAFNSDEKCRQERILINQQLNFVVAKMNDIHKKYASLKYDEYQWGPYIRNWNIEVQQKRDVLENLQFDCVDASDFKITITQMVQLGLAYSSGKSKDINFFIGRIKTDVNSIRENIKLTSEDLKYLKEKESNIPKYKIIEISTNSEVKSVVRVRLFERLTDEKIYLLANKIKGNPILKSERVHIFLFLPKMNLDYGAWAVVDFNPDYELTYLKEDHSDDEPSKPKWAKLKQYTGIWADSQMNGDVAYALRKDSKLGLVMDYISLSNPADCEISEVLKKTTYKGKVKLIKLDNDFGEYYIIENNGDLSIYDKFGKIVTCKKLK
jgi:hypothetical protein